MMDFNLTGQIAANLIQPWYIPLINVSAGVIGGFVTGTLTLFGVYLTIRYYKNRDDQQTYFELASKGRVLIDLYRIFAIHYLYAEKLRLGLEIDEYYLDMNGMDKIAIDKCIQVSSNFALYRDAKNRTEDLKLELVKSIEQFWTNANKNLASFSKKKGSYQKATSIKDAMEKLFVYKFKSSEFDKILRDDMTAQKKAVLKKTPLEWASEEEKKMGAIIEEDGKELTNLTTDLDNNIRDLSTYLVAPEDKDR